MRHGKKVWYDNVLHIPEGTAGAYAIEHIVKPPGAEVLTSTARTAIFRGQAQRQLSYPYATRWHQLTEDGGVWMTDYPIEQIQHDEELKGFGGAVLVGGLGLGYAATALAAKHSVTRVDVVETSAEVLTLVAGAVAHPKVRFIKMDLFDYLKAQRGQADYRHAFYDIWQSDGEHTFHTTVLPLRRLSRGIAKHVTCWNEPVMRGQLFMSLMSRLTLTQLPAKARIPGLSLTQLADGVEPTAPGALYINWATPYWRWIATKKPDQARAEQVARDYVAWYGIAAEDFITSILLR
jgi:NADPH:quinone reductase-like Zn-dependent oxidoreductase